MDKQFETLDEAIKLLSSVDDHIVLNKVDCDTVLNWLREVQHTHIKCFDVVQDISKITKRYSDSGFYQNHHTKIISLGKLLNELSIDEARLLGLTPKMIIDARGTE